MKPILFALPGNETLCLSLVKLLGAEPGQLEARKFPDGESYVRIGSEVAGKEVVLICTLNQPDEKLLLLYFLAQELKTLKAAKITLVAPYLAYMRQDKAFKPGEIITGKYFARLLSGLVDELVTIDPHLHRWHAMPEIYTIPCRVLHATTLIANYIKNQILNPVLIGPDIESKQWVSEVAAQAQAPYLILEKIRRGDKEVEVSVPKVENFKEHNPVLVDDIISTAQTMIATVGHLKAAGMLPATCMGVHGIFAGNAFEALRQTGAEIITCNTITHPTNKLDISPLIAEALSKTLLAE